MFSVAAFFYSRFDICIACMVATHAYWLMRTECDSVEIDNKSNYQDSMKHYWVTKHIKMKIMILYVFLACTAVQILELNPAHKPSCIFYYSL